MQFFKATISDETDWQTLVLQWLRVRVLKVAGPSLVKMKIERAQKELHYAANFIQDYTDATIREQLTNKEKWQVEKLLEEDREALRNFQQSEGALTFQPVLQSIQLKEGNFHVVVKGTLADEAHRPLRIKEKTANQFEALSPAKETETAPFYYSKEETEDLEIFSILNRT